MSGYYKFIICLYLTQLLTSIICVGFGRSYVFLKQKAWEFGFLIKLKILDKFSGLCLLIKPNWIIQNYKKFVKN